MLHQRCVLTLLTQHGGSATFAGNLTAILILVVFLSGPTLLAERRSGRIIMLVLAIFAIGMPALHFSLGSNWSTHSAALFFVWCLIALGVNGLFSVFLWVSELRRLRDEHGQVRRHRSEHTDPRRDIPLPRQIASMQIQSVLESALHLDGRSSEARAGHLALGLREAIVRHDLARAIGDFPPVRDHLLAGILARPRHDSHG